MARVAATCSSFLGDRRGAVLPMVAAGVLMFTGVASLSVDMSLLYMEQNRLQISADEAALAAVPELPDIAAARAMALEVASANMPTAKYGSILAATGIEFGNWDADKRKFTLDSVAPTAVRVVTRRTQANGNATPLVFARVLGYDSADITSEAIATTGISGLELALVLDVSGSMRERRSTAGTPSDDDDTPYVPPLIGGGVDDVDAGGNNGNGKSNGRALGHSKRLARMPVEEKVYTLKRVAIDLLEGLFARVRTSDGLQIAIIPFSGRVNIADHGASWMDKPPKDDKKKGPRLCTGERKNHVDDMDDTPPASAPFDKFKGNEISCPYPAALGLTSDPLVVEDAVLALVAGGTTNTDIGMAFGWRAVSPRWRGEWGNPDHPLDYDSPGSKKAVVIITDGENTPRQTGDKYDMVEADRRLARACEEMKTAGITIFAVNFDAPAYIASLYRKCVSEPSFYFDAKDATGMEQAFERIGEALRGRPLLVR